MINLRKKKKFLRSIYSISITDQIWKGNNPIFIKRASKRASFKKTCLNIRLLKKQKMIINDLMDWTIKNFKIKCFWDSKAWFQR